MVFGGLDVINAFEWGVEKLTIGNLTPLGRAFKWAIIEANALTAGQKRWGKVASVSIDGLSRFLGMDKSLSLTRDIYACLRDPNLEGIPILSPKISVSREVDISENSVIVPENYQRMYIIDNAVPHPRTWSVTGYITSSPLIDSGMILKPSLMMQAKFLDALAKSRRILWFKTDENEMVKVQIASLTIERNAEASNAYPVNMTLKEFVPLQLQTSPWSVVTAIKKGS